VGEERLLSLKNSPNFDADMKKFVDQYYGQKFVKSLLDGPCGSVVISVQEAISTSALDMTKRTEEYIGRNLCNARSCAVFGHSKGGLVVTTMARRCMEMTSLAGSNSCRSIRKFYSASGNNLGASYAALIYGLFIEDPMHPKLHKLQKQSNFFQIDIDLSPSGMTYIPGQTNPMWVDIAPIAPMEDGVPVAIRNNVHLNKEGWLLGDYAAGATNYNFEENSMRLFGCGAWDDLQARVACTSVGFTFGGLHKKNLRYYFEKGLEAWKTDDRFLDPQTESNTYLDQLNWASHQRSDGMAEFDLSMGPCLKGGTAVKSCTTFSKSNHAASAGSGPEVSADVLKFLK
jgi:hypothetical protein